MSTTAAKPRSVDPRRLANETWEAFLSAHVALMRRFAAEGIWRDVSMREYDVLYTLSKCDQPMRLSELKQFSLLSQPALSRMVDRLVARGLLERRADPTDGRGVHLVLTDAGRIQQRRVGGRHAVSVARALSGALEPDELRLLETLCLRLVDGSTDIERHPAGVPAAEAIASAAEVSSAVDPEAAAVDVGPPATTEDDAP